jgi:hypothetical protein
VSRLSLADFSKKGIHSVRGELSLAEMIDFYIQHVKNHAEQMKRNLSVMQI